MSRPNDQLLLKARRTEEHARGGNEAQIATLLRQTATPPSPLTLMSPSKAPRLPARSFSYLGRALVLPHLPVRYSTFPRRKKVATMGHVGLVGDRAFRVPLSVRRPNVSGGARMGDEGKAVGSCRRRLCCLSRVARDLLEVPNLPRGFHTKRSQMEWTLLVRSFKCVHVC